MKMKCDFCKGNGVFLIQESFTGKPKMITCYACEGVGEIEQCKLCNGMGERTIESPAVTVYTDGEKEQHWANGPYEIRPCMACMGNGFVPKGMYNKEK
jgi:RecJ-like exonuclease